MCQGSCLVPPRGALCSRRVLFFFNAPPAPEIYTLSLHDALPIRPPLASVTAPATVEAAVGCTPPRSSAGDRKSTRLNSSHVAISYAVFSLKKKKKTDCNYNIYKNKQKII